MAKIYLSSTFEDLKEFRDAVNHALLKLDHVVVGMENYPASGKTPVKKCLDDVAACEVYVGVIGLRYGYVPEDQGPYPAQPGEKKRSITELEFHHAKQLGKECLVFLADRKSWPNGKTDSETKENENGGRIDEFRKRLEADLVRASFKTPLDLSLAVTTAVTAFLNIPSPSVVFPVATAVAQVREIVKAAILTCSDVDKTQALIQVAALKECGPILFEPNLLHAQSSGEFSALEAALAQSHTSIAVLSPASLTMLTPRADQVARILDEARARTGYCAAVLVGAQPADIPPSWHFSDVFVSVGPPPAQTVDGRLLNEQIAGRCPLEGMRAVGLPLMVLAMTRNECLELLQNPDLIVDSSDTQGNERRDLFLQLRKDLEAPAGSPAIGTGVGSLDQRYGNERRDWRPFAVGSGSLEGQLDAMSQHLNQTVGSRPGGRQIKLQYYPFDSLQDPLLKPIYGRVARGGAVCIIDELSLFHPKLAGQSGLLDPSALDPLGAPAIPHTPAKQNKVPEFFRSELVALVTIAPFDWEDRPSQSLLEERLRSRITEAFSRFSQKLDPQCEFAIGGERRLKRWLWRSLPTTLANLRKPAPDRAALSLFAAQNSAAAGNGVGQALWDPNAP